jgi:hypothetical protein
MHCDLHRQGQHAFELSRRDPQLAAMIWRFEHNGRNRGW